MYLYKGRGEPKVISSTPMLLNRDCRESKFFRVEKDKLIIDQSGHNWANIWVAIISLIIIFLLQDTLDYIWRDYHFLLPVSDIITIVICLSALYSFSTEIFKYKRFFIFDRKNSTITYPEIGFYSKTIPFDDACFIMIRQLNGRSSITASYYLQIRYSIGIASARILNRRMQDAEYVQKLFSLLVWYMDRNRPLPPGDMFDVFREEDSKRRRSEGFPEPLYPSKVNEHT